MIRLKFMIIFATALVVATAIFSRASLNARESLDETLPPFQFYLPITAHNPISKATNCRYGINLSYSRGGAWVRTLGAGHYINFKANSNGSVIPPRAELYRQVRLEQVIENGEYQPKVIYSPPLTMDENGLGPLVLQNPGTVWIIGNEPEVAHHEQDNILPSTYAWAYRDTYHFIKNLDPTAHVANGGLSMMTPGRSQYLDIVWDTYLNTFGEEMPVDIWNMHLYILSEIRPWDGGDADGKIALGTDPALAIRAPHGPPHQECPRDDVYCRAEHDNIDIFEDQVLLMRQWMKDHDQSDKPLILSEYSVLYPFGGYDDPVNPTTCYLMDEFSECFTQERVINYMQKTLHYLETATDPDLGYPEDDHKLVQQWAWFSMYTGVDKSGSSSNLLIDSYHDFVPSDPAAFTSVGHAYRNNVLSNRLTVNLVAAEAANVTVQVEEPEETADAVLSLGFFNNGSLYIDEPVVVVFYSDELLKEVIGGVQISPEETGLINGCSWGRITDRASVTWRDLPVGTHTYWVKVDGQDSWIETNEEDNVITGQVTVLP